MAYTTINKSTDHFNALAYSGTGSTNAVTGVGFQPDWVWIKQRTGSTPSKIFDSVRGASKSIKSNSTDGEATNEENGYLNAIGSDGFTLTAGSTSSNDVNASSGSKYVAWNWKAGGTTPSQTYTVKVVSDSGNKYRFDDFGSSAVTLDLQEGGTYTFDQSDSSNSGHPLRFSTTSNGTHGGGSEYTTGVTVTGTPGNAGAKTVIVVASGVATLYYYCTAHSGMGGQTNTNSTFGSSNFNGTTQSLVSTNITAGFSITKYVGNGTAGATIGHSLGTNPSLIIVKNLTDSSSAHWSVYHKDAFTSQSDPNVIYLNDPAATADDVNVWGNSSVTINSNVFSLGDYNGTNGNNNNMIAYAFSEKVGYSKFGKYIGNNNANGPFIYLGFKPAFIMFKRLDGASNWFMFDNEREGYNSENKRLMADDSGSEADPGETEILSNGFKLRFTSGNVNGAGGSYIYMAFAEAPLVGTNNVPCTAR